MACAVIGATLGCSRTVERDRVGGGWITPFGMQRSFEGIDERPTHMLIWADVKSSSARLVWEC